MPSRRSFLLSALGVSSLALAPTRAFAAQSPAAAATVDPEFSSYLALAPSSVITLDQAAPVTYGNAKLQADTLGFALPFDMADEAARKAWINGTFTVATPSTFRQNGFMDDFSQLTGFEIGQVFSGVELGEPPDVITMIRGALDVDAIRAAQLAAGYQEIDIDGHSVYSLDEDYSLSPDNPIQRWGLSRLNNSAVLDDGTVVYTPARELMRAVLEPEGTLGAQPLVQRAMSTLDAPLITGMVLGPGAFVPGVPMELLEPQSEDEIADFILAMHEQAPAPVVLTGIVGSTAGGPVPSPGEDITPVASGEPTSVTKMALVYLSPGEAETAAEQIENRLATGDSVAQQRPWTDVFTSWSAVPGADPGTLLVTLEWMGVPRSLDLIFNRDIGFITG
jgi:hypothetical protein